MRLRTELLALLVIVLNPLVSEAGNLTLCLSQTGSITARAKCLKSESVVSLSSITSSVSITPSSLRGQSGETGHAGETGSIGPVGEAGAPGPTGLRGKKGLTNIVAGPRGTLDFSACRRIASGPATSSGELSLGVNCDSQNEFLYEDEWSISGGPAFIENISKNSALGSNSETMPYGFQVTTNVTAAASYSLTVKAFCCPR